MGNPAAVRVGPGLLYVAPVGTAISGSAAGTADPSSPWVAVGYTEEGHTFSAETSYEDVEVAEELDPVLVMPVSRQIMLSYSMAEITTRNLSAAFNGGTIGTPASGTVTFKPPNLGAERRLSIFWQNGSTAAGSPATEALLCKKCIQSGNIEINRNKAPNKALIPVEFRLEIPADGTEPFTVYTPSNLPYTDPH